MCPLLLRFYIAEKYTFPGYDSRKDATMASAANNTVKRVYSIENELPGFQNSIEHVDYAGPTKIRKVEQAGDCRNGTGGDRRCAILRKSYSTTWRKANCNPMVEQGSDNNSLHG